MASAFAPLFSPSGVAIFGVREDVWGIGPGFRMDYAFRGRNSCCCPRYRVASAQVTRGGGVFSRGHGNGLWVERWKAPLMMHEGVLHSAPDHPLMSHRRPAIFALRIIERGDSAELRSYHLIHAGEELRPTGGFALGFEGAGGQDDLAYESHSIVTLVIF